VQENRRTCQEEKEKTGKSEGGREGKRKRPDSSSGKRSRDFSLGGGEAGSKGKRREGKPGTDHRYQEGPCLIP